MRTNPIAERRGSVASISVLGLFALLLAVDLALIAGHIGLQPRPVWWNLEADNSYPEKWQYLKWLGACLMLLALAVRRRAAIYLGWAAIFLYFLLDDAASVHERLGGRLVTELGLDRIQQIYVSWFPSLYLRPQDFGELTVALIVGAAIAALLALTWPPRTAPRERTVTKRLVLWLGAFALFAVGADMVHIMVLPVSVTATHVLGVIEDGGEMICASVLVGGLALELARP